MGKLDKMGREDESTKKNHMTTSYKEEDFPVTHQLVKEVISLPMHTELDQEQINFITKLITDFV